jgi:glucokinase
METAKLFTRLLGAEAGNLALIHLPFGGVYLCGGVARAFTEHLGPHGLCRCLPRQGPFRRLHAEFRRSD